MPIPQRSVGPGRVVAFFRPVGSWSTAVGFVEGAGTVRDARQCWGLQSAANCSICFPLPFGHSNVLSVFKNHP